MPTARAKRVMAPAAGLVVVDDDGPRRLSKAKSSSSTGRTVAAAGRASAASFGPYLPRGGVPWRPAPLSTRGVAGIINSLPHAGHLPFLPANSSCTVRTLAHEALGHVTCIVMRVAPGGIMIQFAREPPALSRQV